jgi:hypothetical protein
MSNQTNLPIQKPIPTWRKVLAGILDFITVFFVGGYIIGKLTGGITDDGFSLSGAPALILFALVVAYFYFGWKKFGGTIWQRILRAR